MELPSLGIDALLTRAQTSKVLAGLGGFVCFQNDDDAADGRRADGEVEEDARVRVVGQVREELVLPAHGCLLFMRPAAAAFGEARLWARGGWAAAAARGAAAGGALCAWRRRCAALWAEGAARRAGGRRGANFKAAKRKPVLTTTRARARGLLSPGAVGCQSFCARLASAASGVLYVAGGVESSALAR